MKVHYINILLFALPLNILVNTYKKKPCITQNTKTIRSLCECDLYMPNYDNDAEMKKVMQQFEDRTSQRFHEYDERMKTTRQKCKEQCDKEIQKIILKDKLEKELMDKFATLDTDIQSDAIPTCICEKSLTDKVEKGCLRCGSVLGGGVMPAFGTIGGTTLYALNQLKPTAIAIAIEKALELNTDKILAAGIKAGNTRGMQIVIYYLKKWGIEEYCSEIYKSFVSTMRYAEVTTIGDAIIAKHGEFCSIMSTDGNPKCAAFGLKLGTYSTKAGDRGTPAGYLVPKLLKGLSVDATQAADAAAEIAREGAANAIKAQETVLLEAGFNSTTASIYVSIIAIVVIVLIMVIIYLILRRRRKKKMKKKLQYIKLLEE
ncbi:PIR protein [Plasmodium sp. DRC-Itaito]|nr:PIR protein [Plasmodium sp. DRC-Itaito]